MKSIAVVYPHIKTLDWVKSSIESHRIKADGEVFCYVVDMAWKESEHIEVIASLRGHADHVAWLRVNTNRYRFGEALELVLPLVASVATQSITVIADTDTLMLRQGWDTRLRELLETHQVVSASPRAAWPDFSNVVEWNWMAFNRGGVVGFSGDNGLKEHDWGHYVTARLVGGKYLFSKAEFPFEGKVCAVAGDDDGPWVFHSFFGTSPAVGENRDNCIDRGLCATADEVGMIKAKYGLA